MAVGRDVETGGGEVGEGGEVEAEEVSAGVGGGVELVGGVGGEDSGCCVEGAAGV